MTRRFLIAGNWKMNGSNEMTADLIAGVSRRVLEPASLSEQRQLPYDVLMCPPTPYLAHAVHCAEGQPVKIGSQNVSEYERGAYTGEVSLEMLSEVGCSYALLGHSERRELYGETDQQIGAKFAVCSAIGSQVTPILCVGETLEQRQAGQTNSVVKSQIDAALAATSIEAFSRAVIAYEPVWAIGTGETATPEQAQEVHEFIRGELNTLNSEIAAGVQILYGGSMKPENALELLKQKDIDGGLIGGASLKSESFAAICNAAHELSH